MRIGRRTYDLFYRTWAPWDRVGVRPELLDLLDRGEVAPTTHPRVIDLGCGTGANAVHLAGLGFEVTAVDFSRVALRSARDRARQAGVEARCRFLELDLTAPELLAEEDGRFDLLLDGSTLDDLDGDDRRVAAGHVARLARPGAVLLCWCFYAARTELPAISFTGPSKASPTILPGEEAELFGAHFDVAALRRIEPHQAFLELRRR